MLRPAGWCCAYVLNVTDRHAHGPRSELGIREQVGTCMIVQSVVHVIKNWALWIYGGRSVVLCAITANWNGITLVENGFIMLPALYFTIVIVAVL